MSGTGDSIESVVGSWPIAANRHRNLLTPLYGWTQTPATSSARSLPCKMPQFLHIPLDPGEEVDKICRILSR